MPDILNRFKNAWNAFTSRSPTTKSFEYGGSYYRPDLVRLRYSNEKSIIASIYNKISVDCMNINVRHAVVDENGRFKSEVNSPLNDCLKLNPNIDQTGRSLIQDAVTSMLDEGVVCIAPISADITAKDGMKVYSLRVGKITQWYPTRVEVELYNDVKGRHERTVLDKSMCAIIQNPFYSIMNEPNSTLRRLSRKLSLLDRIDENDYGKLDMIIQLPYAIKSPTRIEQAEKRRSMLEEQLSGSRYGVAYIDGTEHITQLNRSLDNHLLDQINSLKDELYSQLGLTKEVFNGTANEQTMLNYYNQTIEPIMTAITEEMTKKFLSQNARTRGQQVLYIRDPFKLVPINNIADIADKFTRNAILSSNELRGIIGFQPVDDPDADVLRNKNLNMSDAEADKVKNGIAGGTSDDESGSLINQIVSK